MNVVILEHILALGKRLVFSARAGAEFGFMKGSKTRLFLAMWKAYNSTIS